MYVTSLFAVLPKDVSMEAIREVETLPRKHKAEAEASGPGRSVQVKCTALTWGAYGLKLSSHFNTTEFFSSQPKGQSARFPPPNNKQTKQRLYYSQKRRTSRTEARAASVFHQNTMEEILGIHSWDLRSSRNRAVPSTFRAWMFKMLFF